MNAVDLTNRMPAVFDQGTRPTCLACAASDAHQICYPDITSLSVEALFHGCAAIDSEAITTGTTFENLAKVLADQGQPEAFAWPYLAEQPNTVDWRSPSIDSEFFFGHTTLIRPTFSVIQDEINKGRPIVLGMKIRDSLLAYVAEHGLLTDCGGIVRGMHAVLVVGANVGTLETLLIRNSWGVEWGDNGHAIIGRGYFEANVCIAATVTKMERYKWLG